MDLMPHEFLFSWPTTCSRRMFQRISGLYDYPSSLVIFPRFPPAGTLFPEYWAAC
ncbi:hypothetical protein FIBSPDRAFT_870028, partial [Athelia psychrophila]